VLCAGLSTHAQQAIPNPAVSGQWVVDNAALLSDGERDDLRRVLSRTYQRTSAQVVVLTVAESGAGPSRDIAVRQFSTWGLGSAARNDGVLIFVDQRERAVEIVTGKGLTQRLPNSFIAALIREKMTPALRSQKPALALMDGAKEIGARLAEFDIAKQPPLIPLAAAAGVAGLLGLAASFVLYRFRNRALRMPPSGRRQETRHTPDGRLKDSVFAGTSPRRFLLQQAANFHPANFRDYPEWALWAAAGGMTLFAGALAGWLTGTYQGNLEPGFWTMYAIIGLCSAFAVGILGPLNTDDLTALPIAIGGVAIIAGVIPATLINRYLVSDFALAGWIVPAIVIAVNGGFSVFLNRNIQSWEPSQIVCESCGSAIQDLKEAEIPSRLAGWESGAMNHNLVHFRGWRCGGKCTGEYLVWVVKTAKTMCKTCNKPGTVESTKNGWRVEECFLCGATQKEKLPEPVKQKAGGYTAAAASSLYESPSYSSTNYTDNTYQQPSDYGSNDTPQSGGSTDGDGASGNW